MPVFVVPDKLWKSPFRSNFADQGKRRFVPKNMTLKCMEVHTIVFIMILFILCYCLVHHNECGSFDEEKPPTYHICNRVNKGVSHTYVYIPTSMHDNSP